MHITEPLLHYIWKFQLFSHSNLVLTNGQKIEILNAGIHNQNAGPDFFNAQIRIAEIRWAGNIEIHTKTSDWLHHKHQEDENYDKIILHVVWENDKSLFFSNKEAIPTLELKGLIKKEIISNYQSLNDAKTWIPCAKQLKNVDNAVMQLCIEESTIERLQQKTNRIDQILHLTKNDWEACLYQLLGKYFGFKINASPFELLTTSTNYSIIRKVQHNEQQLSALLFGQAGFLKGKLRGSYPLALKKEFDFLKNKFQLEPISNTMWKFMRMRPSNFPTIRLAQFISLFTKHAQLFQKILEAKNYVELKSLFEVEAGVYWRTHYRFDVPASRNMPKKLGEKSIDVLLINVVIPFLYNYATKIEDTSIKEKAIQYLREIKPEKNTTINKWSQLGMPIQSAFDSQGLLQLRTTHCQSKNCLNCTIGNSILKMSI